MELVFAAALVLTIAAVVGGAGLLLGRWAAPGFEKLVQDDDADGPRHGDD